MAWRFNSKQTKRSLFVVNTIAVVFWKNLFSFEKMERLKLTLMIPLKLTSENTNKATQFLITRFIKHGSVIYSEAWLVYWSISRLSNKHFVINHSLVFSKEQIYTQNIVQFWRALEKYFKKPGTRSKYMSRYLGRYFLSWNLFLSVSCRTPEQEQNFELNHLFIPPG